MDLLTACAQGVSGALGLRLLLDPLLEGTLLLLLGHGALRLLRAGPARLRSTLWTLLLVGLVALPATCLLAPRLDVSVVTLPEESPAVAPHRVVTAAGATGPDAAVGTPAAVSARAGAERPSGGPLGPRSRWWSPAVLLWAAVAALGLLRLALRLLRARLAVRDAVPTTDPRLVHTLERIRAEESVGPVRLRLSRRFPVAFVAGLLRPRLVLPATASSWSDEELVAVLRHELAHVRRRDLLRMILADLACALHWHNPLVWRAARAAALAHEMACDDHAARAGGDPRRYARLLLDMAARSAAAGRAAPAPGLARTTDVEHRLRHVLLPPSGGRVHGVGPWRRAAAGAATLLVGALLLGSSAVRTEPASAPAADDSGAALPGVPAPTAADAADLHALCAAGRTADALALLAARPDLLEARDRRGMTPLALAAWHDHAGLLTALLDHGADPDTRNHNGLTPLFCALDRGRSTLARLLADRGADLDVTGYRGWTLLHAAARIGDHAFTRRLLAAGLDPNATSTLGRTPLHLARRHDFTAVCDALLAAGARDIPNPVPWPVSKPGAAKRKALDKR